MAGRKSASSTRGSGGRKAPTHPGEILFRRYVTANGLTQRAMARQLGVHVSQVNSVILGERAVSPDLALRLARVLGTTPAFWLDLQQRWDLWQVQQSPAGKQIGRLERLPRRR